MNVVCRLLTLALWCGWAQLAFAQAPEAASSETGQAPPIEQPSQVDPAVAAPSRMEEIAERLEILLLAGEVVWLNTEAGRFLAVQRPPDRLPAQGALIVHISPGRIVDSAPFYRALAAAATAGKWHVLSLQSPFLPVDGEQPPAEPAITQRLDAAIAHLRQAGIGNIVIAGDAEGAALALELMLAVPEPPIAGFVAIGSWPQIIDAEKFPILSVFGTRDKFAMRHAKRRAAKTRSSTTPVEVLEIDGADPRFYGYEELAAKRIRGWLGRATPGGPSRAPLAAN